MRLSFGIVLDNQKLIYRFSVLTIILESVYQSYIDTEMRNLTFAQH